jgi:soluble lytic murein transglycosylase-like protein
MGILRPRFPADEPMPPEPQGVLASAIAPKHAGFFGGGGTGSKIASFLMEALSGIPSTAHRQQRQDRDLAMFERKSMLQQQLESAQWQQQQDYQRAHPAPYRFEANNGDQMEIGPDGQPRTVYKDPTAKLVRNYDGTWSTMPSSAPITAPVGKLTPIAPGGAGSGPRTFQPSAVMDSLIAVESGGRAGIQGPQTPYGRAQGLTQMLPATAQGIATKLGVPWRADLMTGASPDAAAYQRALGQAYLEEGYKATGNIRDALHYYHGGPSRKLWGPKTRAYADNVISRLGSQ